MATAASERVAAAETAPFARSCWAIASALSGVKVWLDAEPWALATLEAADGEDSPARSGEVESAGACTVPVPDCDPGVVVWLVTWIGFAVESSAVVPTLLVVPVEPVGGVTTTPEELSSPVC